MSYAIYQSLKSDAINIYSGLSDEDVEHFEDRVHEFYEKDLLTEREYDDIMRIIQDA